MPRKAKETLENEEKIVKVEKKKNARTTSSSKEVASSSKKTTTIKKNTTSTTKKASVTNAKKSTTTKKNEASSKVNDDSKKATTKRASTTTKKTTASTKKPAIEKKATSKTTTSKKSTARKTTTKKTKTTLKKAIAVPEYYDLPYHYNQTVVKVLAQTPKTLFVYWDISDDDRENYIKHFGADFFNNTTPFLRVKNESNGYYFDVDVDDFANGWYLHVDDSKCNYSIELLRKQRAFVSKVIDHPVYITSSNVIETPNDHILLDSNLHTVFYRNVKTGEITSKDIANIALLKKIGKIYNIYDLYKKIYKSDEIFDLNNPTSGNPTSTFM